MRNPSTFHALRNRNFRLFFGGQLISLVGTWMQIVGQAWLVLHLTGSALALGTVAAFQFLPVSLFTLIAGVFVDRLPKRHILLATQSAALGQALLLAILVHSGCVRLWHVYVLASSLGFINCIDNPARKAFIMEMVGREDLVNAVALNSTMINAARVVGPALGGILIAKIGMAPCFYLNAASFTAVLAGLACMRGDLHEPSAAAPRARALADLREGLRFALATPSVFMILILMFALGTFAYNFNTVLPLLAKNALSLGADGFGSLASAQGAGSLAAALVVASRARISECSLLCGAIGMTALLAALAGSRSYLLSLAIMALLGISSVAFSAAAQSLLQLLSPDRMRGRIMSLHTLLFLGTTPVGGLATGWFAQMWGIRAALLVESTLCATGIVLALAPRALALLRASRHSRM
jgi:MFS family permease